MSFGVYVVRNVLPPGLVAGQTTMWYGIKVVLYTMPAIVCISGTLGTPAVGSVPFE